MTEVLAGMRAAVTGTDLELGRGLARAFAAAGASVAELDGCFPSRAAAEDACRAAAVELGGPIDALVHAAMTPVAFDPVPFDLVDDVRFDLVWEQSLRSAIFLLQAVHPQMAGRGGSVTFVTPTVSMSGAARLAPYTAAVEGLRILAKSAARQWGAAGIRVNCLAPAPEHVPIGVSSTAVSLSPPALGGPGDVATDLGPVAVYLASAAAHFVTGLTLCADGGVWMAP